MMMDAARRFLNILDISGEEIEKALRDEFQPTQMSSVRQSRMIHELEHYGWIYDEHCK